jgi:acyl-coenzyme A thioesterase PaaI-like protein
MTGFDLLPRLAKGAGTSGFQLWLLNVLLGRVIPFNRPHGFKIVQIDDNLVCTEAPCRRSNHNHIRGIHACALATVAEFSAGFLLMQNFAPADYRLIMSRMDIEYKYQAKERVVSESRLSGERIEREILQPLETAPSVDIKMRSDLIDDSGNLVAVAHTFWQIKRWDRVRTRL